MNAEGVFSGAQLFVHAEGAEDRWPSMVQQAEAHRRRSFTRDPEALDDCEIERRCPAMTRPSRWTEDRTVNLAFVHSRQR